MGGKRTLDCPRFAKVEHRQEGNARVEFDNLRQSYDTNISFSVCAWSAEELPIPSASRLTRSIRCPASTWEQVMHASLDG